MFSDLPPLSGAKVVFQGVGEFDPQTSTRQTGIYFFNGATLSRVSHQNTPIPEGSGNFNGVSSPLVNGTDVVFWGSGSGGQTAESTCSTAPL